MGCFASGRYLRDLKCWVFLLAVFSMGLVPSVVRAQAELTSQWGFQPTMAPSRLAYSPDGTLLAVAGPGGVSLYFASTRMPYRGLATGVGQVESIAFSPDGKMLAVGGSSSSGVLQLWNVSTGKLSATFLTAATSVNSIAFSPSGSILVSGGIKINASTKTSIGVVEQWNVSSQVRISTIKTSATIVDAVAVSPNGKTIVVGGSNASSGVLEVWNASTGALLQNLGSVSTTSITTVVFAQNSNVIAVGGVGASGALVQMWDLEDGCPQTLTDTDSGAVSSVAFSPDGTKLAAVGCTSSTVNGKTECSGQLQVWNLNTAAVIQTATSGWNLSSLAFSPDGSTLADLGTTEAWSGGQSGAFETTSGFFELRNVNAGFVATSATYTAHANASQSVCAPSFSSDGTMVVGGGIDLSGANSGSQHGALNVWNTAKGTVLKSIPVDASPGVYLTAFSPDNKSLALAGAGAAEFWNISSGTLEGSFDTGLIGDAIAYSPNGKLVAIGGQNAEGNSFVQVWNLGSGKMVAKFASESNQGVFGLTFSPDSSKVAVSGSLESEGKLSEGVLELWNVVSGGLTARFATKEAAVYTAAFSPDGKTLVAGGFAESTMRSGTSGRLELWSVATERLSALASLVTGTTRVSLIAYSPNGKTLYAVTGGATQQIQMFDAASAQRLGYFTAPAATFFALAPINGAVASSAGGLLVSTMPTK